MHEMVLEESLTCPNKAAHLLAAMLKEVDGPQFSGRYIQMPSPGPVSLSSFSFPEIVLHSRSRSDPNAKDRSFQVKGQGIGTGSEKLNTFSPQNKY